MEGGDLAYKFRSGNFVGVESQYCAVAVLFDHGCFGFGDMNIFFDEIDLQKAFLTEAISQFFQRTVRKNLAVADHHDSVAERFDIVHIVRCEDHR
jgi:hypothetical protein